MPECVLKVTVKPKKRDLTNITPEMLAKLDPSHEIIKELEKLAMQLFEDVDTYVHTHANTQT